MKRPSSREAEVRRAVRVGLEAGAIGLVGGEAFERDQRERDVVGALVRHEIAEQVAAAFRDDGLPAPGILLERVALERIEHVADAAGDGHGCLLVWMHHGIQPFRHASVMTEISQRVGRNSEAYSADARRKVFWRITLR